MNILIDLLPSSVEIDNKKYEINSDFRTSIIFSQLMEEDNIDQTKKVEIGLRLFYPEIPHDITEAVEKIQWFYGCGKEIKRAKIKGKGVNKRILDYEEDADYIYSAFMSQYKIDLQDIEYLHWWKFQSLFNGLKNDNKICEIMKYRSIDLSQIKDKEERKFYKDMQELYKLDEKINKADLEALNKWNKVLKDNC